MLPIFFKISTFFPNKQPTHKALITVDIFKKKDLLSIVVVGVRELEEKNSIFSKKERKKVLYR